MSQDYGRRVLTGVLDYAATHDFGPVELFDPTDWARIRADADKVDGWIAVLQHNERALFDSLPGIKVLVPHLSAPTKALSVATDAVAVGQMAAEHLLSLGLRNLAAIPSNEPEAFAELLRGFSQTVEAAGATLLLQPTERQSHADATAWIAGLPKPCGILCQKDSGAIGTIERIIAAGLRVPQDVAVIGVQNDLIHCMHHRPTLTSVAVPAEHLGWLAAQTLQRRLRTGKAQSVTVPPTGVVARQSTNTVIAGDPSVVEAVLHMRMNLARRLDVVALARRAGVSRRTLEYRFSQHLGRSIQEELNRLRLDRALTLLRLPDSPLKQIAIEVGFKHQGNFTRFVQERTGQPPLKFRNRHSRKRV
jgi:LacI family transcriptional regulator